MRQENFDKISEKIHNLNWQLEIFQQMITKNEQRILNIEDKSEETDQKMQEIKEGNQRLMQTNKDLKDSVAVL